MSDTANLEEHIACLEMLLSCGQKEPVDLNILESLNLLQSHWTRVLGSLPSDVRDVLRVTGVPNCICVTKQILMRGKKRRSSKLLSGRHANQERMDSEARA
jgi:hypothetical protein